MLVPEQRSRYEQARVRDAAVNRYARRLAAHDGTSFPLGVAVLLFPDRRSDSSCCLLGVLVLVDLAAFHDKADVLDGGDVLERVAIDGNRSEERRVGKECRSRW